MKPQLQEPSQAGLAKELAIWERAYAANGANTVNWRVKK